MGYEYTKMPPRTPAEKRRRHNDTIRRMIALADYKEGPRPDGGQGG